MTRKWNNVYIAAASSDIERVIRVRAQLVAGGLAITSRWIDEVKATGANPDDDTERRRRVNADKADVRKSDVVLFLVPHGFYYLDGDRVMSSGHEHSTRGAWFEIGYADGLGIPFVAVAPRKTLIKSIFTSIGEEFENDVDAVIRLLRFNDAAELLGDGLDRPNPYTKDD